MVAASAIPARRDGGSFYVWVAAFCALLAFGSFAPTYWLQLPAGTFVGPPILHIHGILFSAWTLLFLLQTVLAASGRIVNHRAWGLAAVSLATAMVAVGLAAAIGTVAIAQAAGFGEQGRAFLIVQVSALGLFAGFFLAAIISIVRRRPETHKRFMVLATFALIAPVLARIFFLIATHGGGPGLRPGLGHPLPVAAALLPAIAVLLLVGAVAVYEWRTRGRPHPVWLIGGAIMAAVYVGRVPLSATPGWQALAEALTHIAG